MSLIIDLKVIPGARYNKIVLDKSGKIVCYMQSVAQDNKANQELIKTLGLKLKIPKSCIAIVGGSKSKYKRVIIHLENLTINTVLHALDLVPLESNIKPW